MFIVPALKDFFYFSLFWCPPIPATTYIFIYTRTNTRDILCSLHHFLTRWKSAKFSVHLYAYTHAHTKLFRIPNSSFVYIKLFVVVFFFFFFCSLYIRGLQMFLCCGSPALPSLTRSLRTFIHEIYARSGYEFQFRSSYTHSLCVLVYALTQSNRQLTSSTRFSNNSTNVSRFFLLPLFWNG